MDLTAQPTGAAPQFYIPATASLLERRPRTLKHGDTFAVFDHYGDFSGGPQNPEGLYFADTRYLSLSRIDIEGRTPLLLSSMVQDNNALLTVDLTNPDVYRGEDLVLARNTVHLLRSKFLWSAGCYERIVVHNYGSETHTVTFSLAFEADFHDVFEVRGLLRPVRGTTETAIATADRVVLRYTGLDQKVRDTELNFDPPPFELREGRAEWRITVGPGERKPLFITVGCGAAAGGDRRFVTNLRRAHRERLGASARIATVRTSNAIFNELLCRSTADLVMLVTDTRHGRYPYAGIPWFSTAFGRDGIITAIELLAFDPSLARGVLTFLAAAQARGTDAAHDAEPGKILHETRQGEMAVLGEVPFGLYYGSVDSTPLFVLLAGLYWKRTADLDTIRALWPNILAALEWIDRYGDRDGDGFVEYLRKSADGLANQGWKDSEDSIFHADGVLARGSVALCEVQAYVYAAKVHGANLARALADGGLAERLEREAETLRERFEERFWMEDEGCYALALDGDKKPCHVVTSNAGHALFCGIASPERAARVAQRLARPDLSSGWGIRTVSALAARYNPMSYHDGSVWPHDNALIALGLARYGHTRGALAILRALFEASSHMDPRRLPELFCGFARKPRRGPTFYPVACAPQAWASAAPFALLSAVLGLEFDAASMKIRFLRPQLPDFLDEIELNNMRVGSTAFDIGLSRRGHDVAVTILRKTGPLSVEMLP